MLKIKAQLLNYSEELRSSYWFLPAVMAFGAIVLSFLMTKADVSYGAGWISNIGWLYENKPAGARALLSTIAGSMIGVAGVTFSITIAAVSFTSGQFGPRILTNFMRDTGNQVTLGTFIATFLYCLLILRTVRSGSEGGEEALTPFVPHIAILFGLVLTLASLGVLIFFIHHIPESIHISNVLAGIGRELDTEIRTLFPTRIGFDENEHETEDFQLPDLLKQKGASVKSDKSGYIQHLDSENLIDLAKKHNLILYLHYRPGDFVNEGKPLLVAWPAGDVTEKMTDQMHAAFILGAHRTQFQDVLFLINELVEIAARALSPGVNDPFTAMSCLDWLGSAMISLNIRSLPETYRFDEENNLRILAAPTTYKEFIQAAFGQLRPYLRADENAAKHALKIIGDIGIETENTAKRAVLKEEADKLVHGCKAVMLDFEYAEIKNHYDKTISLLEREKNDRSFDKEWLDLEN